MKPLRYLILPLAALFAGLATVSCTENEGPVEEAGEKVDDALDQRPAEEVRDAVEDATD